MKKSGGIVWFLFSSVPPVCHGSQCKTPQSLERGVFIGGERGT